MIYHVLKFIKFTLFLMNVNEDGMTSSCVLEGSYKLVGYPVPMQFSTFNFAIDQKYLKCAYTLPMCTIYREYFT